MNTRTLIEQMLEALELSFPRYGVATAKYSDAVHAARKWLAAPEGEPVAWMPFQSLKIKDKPFLSAQPQHETTSQCWCNPEVDYVDPGTGVTVYVHKEPQ